MDDSLVKLLGEFKGKKSTNKKLRRNLRRMAERKNISYDEAILKFYGIRSLSQLDKNLLYSLYKN